MKKTSYLSAITCPYCGKHAAIKVGISDCSLQFLHEGTHCSPTKNPVDVMEACGKTLSDLMPPDVFASLKLTGKRGFPSTS